MNENLYLFTARVVFKAFHYILWYTCVCLMQIWWKFIECICFSVNISILIHIFFMLIIMGASISYLYLDFVDNHHQRVWSIGHEWISKWYANWLHVREHSSLCLKLFWEGKQHPAVVSLYILLRTGTPLAIMM